MCFRTWDLPPWPVSTHCLQAHLTIPSTRCMPMPKMVCPQRRFLLLLGTQRLKPWILPHPPMHRLDQDLRDSWCPGCQLLGLHDSLIKIFRASQPLSTASCTVKLKNLRYIGVEGCRLSRHVAEAPLIQSSGLELESPHSHLCLRPAQI